MPLLDLSRAPPVLYFYGIAGAGKNFLGDLVGRMAGRHVYHADADLTPDMRLAITEKRAFTEEMRDRYYIIVAEKIIALRSAHERLVVTQGTYKRRHRDYLASAIPGMDMICVTAPDSVIMERLRERGDAVTPDYAAAIRANFEPPPGGAKLIVNEAGEAGLVAQLNGFYGGAP